MNLPLKLAAALQAAEPAATTMIGPAPVELAAMAVKEGITVQKANITALQNKLRVQHQIIDFLPGQPDKCEHLNDPPEF